MFLCLGEDIYLRLNVLVFRRGYIFEIKCSGGPGLNSPLISDPSGLFIRRNGLIGHYLVGKLPDPEEVESTFLIDLSICRITTSFLKNSLQKIVETNKNFLVWLIAIRQT